MQAASFPMSHLAATLYLPTSPTSICYVLEPEEVVAPIAGLAEEYHMVLCAISGMDWTHDLPPWDAPRVFKAEGDFYGGADPFLALLTEKLLPEAERRAGLTSPPRILCGISLAGLFALYAGYRSDRFSSIASISGSLWFDGWISFMKSHALSPAVEKVYLSLGDKEKKARNPRMRRVEDCTREAKEILTAQHIPTTFELNPGNHFVDGPRRVEKALRWTTKAVKSEK